MQHMHGIIPNIFVYWADPVVRLLLLKSSMGLVISKLLVTCASMPLKSTFVFINCSNRIKLDQGWSIKKFRLNVKVSRNAALKYLISVDVLNGMIKG